MDIIDPRMIQSGWFYFLWYEGIISARVEHADEENYKEEKADSA